MAHERIPQVGVIVPAHNAEPFLAETLDAVLAQTVGDWVAWVADDASTDGTRALIESYAQRDPRIRPLALDHNVGVVEARRRLVQASAPTELIALLDHDDVWREHYLERSLQLIDDARERGERPGIAASDALFLTRDGVSSDTVAERFGLSVPVTYDRMLHKNAVFARAVFSREAYDATGGFAPECAGADDYDLWLQILEAGYSVVSTREALTLYRWEDAGMSRRRSRMFAAHLATYRRAIARGRLTPAQRRVVWRRMLHYRMLLGRQRVVEALTRS